MATLDENAFEQQAQDELAQLEESGSETSKLKQLFGVLKKTVGVKDLASLRLSLPANLLHPQGNLEYWHYLDRPDVFAAIGDSNDGFQRMLAVLRWVFTKDLKVNKGKVCKPYNSVLGEQFRALWDVYPATVDAKTGRLLVSHGIDTGGTPRSPSQSASSTASLRTPSVKSPLASPVMSPSQPTAGSSTSSLISATSGLTANPADSTPATSTNHSLVREREATSMPKHPNMARVVFLNEQCSHHPPVSSFWYESHPPDNGPHQRVVAYGVDQLSARFTGTSVKVYAGEENHGIYVKLPERSDEEYRITHPVANITGFLRGSPYVTISDACFVTCLSPDGKSTPGTKALRAIIGFVDESWIGKARFAVEGVIYEYVVGSEGENYTKPKQVPEAAIKGYIEGSWRGKVSWKPTKGAKAIPLIDLGELLPLPKMVRPTHLQHDYESRKLWHPVTSAIQSKQFSQATKNKQTIEQRQREIAAERSSTNTEHQVVFFEDKARFEAGRPKLSARGEAILQAELAGKDYDPLDTPTELLGSLSL